MPARRHILNNTTDVRVTMIEVLIETAIPTFGMSTNDSCDEWNSLYFSESSNNENSVGSGAEIMLKIPSTIAHFPLGFALDVGSSVTKVVYRSKLDYTSGQPNNGQHILRLTICPRGNGGKLVQFLKEICDVRVTSSAADDPTNGDGKRPLHYQTGVGLQHVLKAVEEGFQCTIEARSEMDMCFNTVLKLSEMIPELKRTTPFSVESTRAAQLVASGFISMMMKYQQAGVNPFGDTPPPPSDVDVPALCAKLVTADPTTIAEELNGLQIKYPCVFIQCGSATVCTILHENGRQEIGDIKRTAGKTLIALARLTTKIKSFKELVELASDGDFRKVDILVSDVKNRDHLEADLYSMMPDSFHAYALGKAAEERYDGTYSRADVASALIYMQCRQLANLGINVARRHQLTSVVYFGSFVDWPLTQNILQECFLCETLLQPVMGEAQKTMHMFPHSSFLTALGVWYENTKTTDTQ